MFLGTCNDGDISLGQAAIAHARMLLGSAKQTWRAPTVKSRDLDIPHNQ
jgi:hypothetical protein